ncbi:hypothetical protein O5833_29285, partial [Escherichia coli]|nr:hypothetical protein [Escherichia coli]
VKMNIDTDTQWATWEGVLIFAFNVQFYRQLITAGRFFTFG